MKIIISILFLVPLSIYALGQSDDINRNKLSLSVECYEKVIDSNKSVKVILMITNESRYPQKIPSEYLITFAKWSRGIVYEMYYCSKDTEDAFKHSLSSIHQDFLVPDSTVIYPGNSFLISTYISAFFMQRKGLYKIRYTLKKKDLERYLTDDIHSQWIYVRRN